MYKLILLVLFTLTALTANKLVLENGEVIAHTEIFGDKNIDPKTKKIYTNLQYENDFSNIKGTIWINSIDLESEDSSRDKNMYDLLKSKINPKISFDFINVRKIDKDNYMIEGFISLNKVSRKVKALTKISKSNNKVFFDGVFNIHLTDYNLEPPTLLFLTVRNKIDIKYNFEFSDM